MPAGSKTAYRFSLLLALCACVPTAFCTSFGPEQANQQSTTLSKSVGVIKAIAGNTITLAPDAGPEIKVLLQDSTRLVRIPPGEKSLKNAVPVQSQDLKPGDRILVYGKPAANTGLLDASTVVVMKQTDVAAKQAQDLEDWQKSGLGGVVEAVDAASGTIAVAQPSLNVNKSIAIHTTKATLVRRYSPDSFEFVDATPSTLADIKVGDQVRARGAHSADESSMEAVEVVSGTFRNLAGTVISTDTSANTVTVLNLANKKPLLVRVKPDSQLRRLPAPIAQRIALGLKGGSGANQGTAGEQATPANSAAHAPSSTQADPGAMGEHAHGGGLPDLQQTIARTPTITLADLQKGDAVQILSTEGTTSGVTAIMLIAGVEPILQASPKGGQGMVLSPWSLGGNGGGEAESQ